MCDGFKQDLTKWNDGKVVKSLECSVCKCVPKNPAKCPECQNVVCSELFKKKVKKCPTCKKCVAKRFRAGGGLALSPLERSAYDGLKVGCSACGVQVFLEEYAAHKEKECRKRKRSCQWMCDEDDLHAENVEAHQKTCKERKSWCPTCSAALLSNRKHKCATFARALVTDEIAHNVVKYTVADVKALLAGSSILPVKITASRCYELEIHFWSEPVMVEIRPVVGPNDKWLDFPFFGFFEMTLLGRNLDASVRRYLDATSGGTRENLIKIGRPSTQSYREFGDNGNQPTGVFVDLVTLDQLKEHFIDEDGTISLRFRTIPM